MRDLEIFYCFLARSAKKKVELITISRLDGHMYAIRRTKPVPGAYLIGGESRSASQSLSTRTKFGDQQYMEIAPAFANASEPPACYPVGLISIFLIVSSAFVDRFVLLTLSVITQVALLHTERNVGPRGTRGPIFCGCGPLLVPLLLPPGSPPQGGGGLSTPFVQPHLSLALSAPRRRSSLKFVCWRGRRRATFRR